MKLTVFGATGGTGRQVVEQALAAGHDVTAVVRDPARLTLQHARLQVLCADVRDPAAIAPALTGSVAAISALGPRSRDRIGICSAGAQSILTAMRATGVRRFVGISAGPVAAPDPGDRLLYRLILRRLARAIFKSGYADLARMEDEVRRSGLDWTILRPPRLTDKPYTGRYRTALNHNVPGGYAIARADLADAIIKLVADSGAVNATVGIGY